MEKQLLTSVIICLLIQCCYSQFDCFGEGLPVGIQDRDAVAKANENFSLKLFTDIATSYPFNSIVLSPYSVWSVLNLAYFGAGGRTRDQLANALDVSGKGEAFYGSLLLDSSLTLDPGTTFNKADKAYFADDLQLRQCAIDKIVDIEKLDFTNSDVAANKINSDISNATRGKINRFLSPGIIANSRFVLINALYFKGLWKFPFPKGRTTQRPFYDESRKKIVSEKANMMTRDATLKYYNSDELGASFLELPYDNSNISMILALPTIGKSTVNTVLQQLNPFKLEEIAKSFQSRKTIVSIPRFKMTTRIADELKAGLQNLGVFDLFDASSINMTDFIPSERVKVDDALHHATIEVTEEGTVASAATGLVGTRSGASVVNFVADRPFLFLIRDMSLKTTIMMGVLRNPNHTQKF